MSWRGAKPEPREAEKFILRICRSQSIEADRSLERGNERKYSPEFFCFEILDQIWLVSTIGREER